MTSPTWECVRLDPTEPASGAMASGSDIWKDTGSEPYLSVLASRRALSAVKDVCPVPIWALPPEIWPPIWGALMRWPRSGGLSGGASRAGSCRPRWGHRQCVHYRSDVQPSCLAEIPDFVGAIAGHGDGQRVTGGIDLCVSDAQTGHAGADDYDGSRFHMSRDKCGGEISGLGCPPRA